MKRTHLDLFSGIGGFALAARWAGLETIGFSEIDPYCCKVLEKNFPGVPNYGDIHKITAGFFDGSPFLLTGGFPCQSVSLAGKRKGATDDRHLWPEIVRVIAEVKPDWFIGENVLGFVSLGLDAMLSELETSGYSVGTIIVPAAAVDAPQVRDRVWILANRQGQQPGQLRGEWSTEESETARPLSWAEGQPEPQRMADGVPDRMDRLTAIGNAIVAQVAYEIIQAIVNATRWEPHTSIQRGE